MKATRRKNIHQWEQQPKKKRSKKMKISVMWRKRSSEEEEEEGTSANSDYFNKLSTDVITSLLLRCTLNSLSMLRCTSKSWNNFIISPSFLHSHLRQSAENGPKLLYLEKKCLHRSKSSRLRFVSVDMDGSKEELYTVTFPDTQLACATMRVCFGLVCLSTDCRLYLCNPALQQLCELPEYSLSAIPGYDHFGFGYLHSRKEYKVVHFFYSVPSMNKRWCYLGDLRLPHLKCEVLTINKVGGISFNRWKEIADQSPFHPRTVGLLVNECMYWNTYCLPRARTNPILSFDFENEKFQAISPPSPLESDLGLCLMDFKGMLCLPDAGRFSRSSILDLWILKDKISCTWVKEYSIRLNDFGSKEIMSAFKTFSNEEIVFQHLGTMVFYDLKRKSFRKVEALSAWYNTFGIYSKSLFSLGTNHVGPS